MQTTVVGNYPKIPNRPRPARLRVAINKRDRGEISNEDLSRVEAEVTVEVIGEQIEAGVDIVTDGLAARRAISPAARAASAAASEATRTRRPVTSRSPTSGRPGREA